MDWKKGLITGIAAGVLLIMISFVSMLYPATGEWYSKTFPQMMNPTGMLTGPISSFMMGLIMGLIYSIVHSSIPGKGLEKGVRYGIIVWLLAGLMWPIMMMSFAPVNIWIMELLTGLITYSIVGVIISLIYQKI
jgi:hypothetical protein